MTTAPTVVILAAGHGTRMRSALPKVLHDVCGRPMIEWIVAAAREAGAAQMVVVDGPERALAADLPGDVVCAVQAQRRGTADAARAAIAHIEAAQGPVVVLPGDVPLITPEVIVTLVEAHGRARAAATVATMELEDPGRYGRIVRDADGQVERVVETKRPEDATPDELAIREVNTGLMAFDPGALIDALERVRADNAQSEYYLPDVIPTLRAAGHTVAAVALDDPAVLLGVNDRADLATVTAHAQRRIHEAHMRAGVTIVDPASTLIEAGVALAPDMRIEPACFLRGATRVGAGSRIGPVTTLIDCDLGEGVTVPHSYLVECRVAAGASVGPFAYLRPGAVLDEGAKAGTFVEIKNSRIGAGAKVPHLSYIGDADVGPGTNLGAATITANYDGQRKHRTTIGSEVRTSVDTTLVAPVNVGDGAYTAAGSVITEDIPAGGLGVARQRQRNVEGYAERKAAERDDASQDESPQDAPPEG